jgi:hypothetical protein
VLARVRANVEAIATHDAADAASAS